MGRTKNIVLSIFVVFVCLLILPIAAEQVTSGIVPVQAKLILTMKLRHSDGTEETQLALHQTYARNSDGSVYQKTERNDQETGEVRTLISVSSIFDQAQYMIDPEEKLIKIGRQLFRNPTKSFSPRQWPDHLRRETYLGKTCVVSPIEGGEASGEVWYEENTNFIMYMRVERSTAEGDEIKTTEATDFVSGIEANPELFQIPQEGYTVEDLR